MGDTDVLRNGVAVNLPIDARQAPFPDKYLDEETLLFARWFFFGGETHLHGPTYVDVAWKDGDVFVGLTFQQAEQLCLARDMFIDEVLRIVNKREPS